MLDVVVVSKHLLEKLLETVECNDPRNEYLNSVRHAIAENDQLMERADAVMHRNHDESPGPAYSEYDYDAKRWIIMGEFDVDALKIMTIFAAKQPAKPEGVLVPWSVLGVNPDDL